METSSQGGQEGPAEPNRQTGVANNHRIHRIQQSPFVKRRLARFKVGMVAKGYMFIKQLLHQPVVANRASPTLP